MSATGVRDCVEVAHLDLRDGFAVCFTFMRRLETDADRRARGGRPFGLHLAALRRRLADEQPRAAAALIEPLASIGSDIVHPIFEASHLPLLFTPEPPLARDEAVPEVRVHRPAASLYRAEDLTCRLRCAPKRDVRFGLRECCALFGSGHFAYSLALGAPETEGADAGLDEYLLIQLRKLVHPTEGLTCLREARSRGGSADTVRFSGLGLPALDLLRFVNRRLDDLWSRRNGPFHSLLGGLLVPADARFPTFAWSDLVGGAVLVESPELYADLCRLNGREVAAAPAESVSIWRAQPQDAGGEAHMALADAGCDRKALVLGGALQHVLDFPRQDPGEIADAVAPLLSGENWFLFNHPKVLTEVVVDSRSFRTMRRIVGVCPYLLLVHLTLSHNDALLREASERMAALAFDHDRPEPVAPVRGEPLQALARALESAHHAFGRRTAGIVQAHTTMRLDVYRATMLAYIPNMFRYPSERDMYDRLAEARGLAQQHDRLVKDLDYMRLLVQDIDNTAQVHAARRLNQLVLVFGMIGVVTVLRDIDKPFAEAVPWMLKLSVAGVLALAGAVLLWIGGQASSAALKRLWSWLRERR